MTTAQNLVGCAGNRSEAEIILASLLGRPRNQLYTTEIHVPPAIEDRFFELLEKRKTHIPLQYLLRNQPFLDFDLVVDERVLIPRFETEELVARIFSKIKKPEILFDIGTGSAAIAIALARHYPAATVIATDISTPALEVAAINIARYGLQNRIRLYAADLFNFPGHQEFRTRVDLIVSNPPYIRSGELNRLMTEVRDYEPLIALDGGPDGLTIIRPLIQRAPDFLKPGGLVAIEIDPGLVPAITTLAKDTPVIEKDFSGLDRYLFFHARRYSAETFLEGAP